MNSRVEIIMDLVRHLTPAEFQDLIKAVWSDKPLIDKMTDQEFDAVVEAINNYLGNHNARR